MTNFRSISLFASLASFPFVCAWAAANMRIKQSSKVHNGTEYIIDDGAGPTQTQAIPPIWLSDTGVNAIFEDAFPKCNELGDRWELVTIDNARMSHAVALAIRNENNYKNPNNDSDPFWVAAFFYDTHFQFLWEKDGSPVEKQKGESPPAGEIDRSKFYYDYFSGMDYGLLAFIPGNLMTVTYKPTYIAEKRRYICAMTGDKQGSPLKPMRHHKKLGH